LKPFDKKSIGEAVSYGSAVLPLAIKLFVAVLYGFIEVSKICQGVDALDDDLTRINLGLNPVKTKVPSVEAFPVYEPNAEYPATCAKQ
jgi:hypothetical protein